MPFQYVLANVLSDIPTSEAVAFLDSEGETVALITREEHHDEVKIFGAYQGIFLEHLKRILHEEVSFFYYRTEKNGSYTIRVGDDYFMVVITRDPQPIEHVRRIMVDDTDSIRRLFLRCRISEFRMGAGARPAPQRRTRWAIRGGERWMNCRPDKF